MQRALQELEREGLVFSQRTAGRFVTEDITVIDEIKKTLAKGQIESFLKAMKELGYDRQGIIDLLKEDE
jgi:DNA-binding transcriptional regulator YhcF (GntR family)